MMDDRKVQAELDGQIDAALRAIGSAAPAAGMEGRILTRLAAARSGAERPVHSTHRVFRFMIPLAGIASVSLICGVIVVASVNHSHRSHPGMAVPPPILQMQGGVGAASAVHPAPPASAVPVPAGPAARGHSTHKAAQHGRARIAPHAKRAPGVALPAPAAGTPQ